MAVTKRKYEDVVKTLPRLPAQDVSRQEKLDAIKVAYRQGPEYRPGLTQLAVTYAEWRAQKAELERKEEEVNLYLDAFTEMMAEQFEVEGAERLTTSKFAVSVYLEPYASVQDRDAFRQWCVAQGLERSMMLPWQTTNMLTKQRLLDGAPEPDGVVAYSKPKIRLERK